MKGWLGFGLLIGLAFIGYSVATQVNPANASIIAVAAAVALVCTIAGFALGWLARGIKAREDMDDRPIKPSNMTYAPRFSMGGGRGQPNRADLAAFMEQAMFNNGQGSDYEPSPEVRYTPQRPQRQFQVIGGDNE